MSQRSPRVIVAPESPPASPRSEALVWAARTGRHVEYEPGRPRAIVQRSRFTIQNPPEVTAYVNRISRQSSSHSSSSYARYPKIFKMDEDVKDSFHLPQSTQQSGSQRHRQRKPRSVRRSESMDSLSEELRSSSRRRSEYEHDKDPSALPRTWDPSLSQQRPSSSNRRISVDFPQPLSEKRHVARSAPIPIPSRSKQMEDRKNETEALQRARERMGTRAASSSSYVSRFYRPYRAPPPRPRSPLVYDSSSDD